MNLSRRDFMKANAAMAAATAAGLAIPVKNVEATESEIKWDKAVCRFCGTGCAVLVGTKDGRVVASQGDPDAEVNRGLNCIKGYFLPKIMYGKDRLTQPMLRMKDGKYDKNGDFTPVSWDVAFKTMAEKFKAAVKELGPNGVGMFSSGQTTIFEGYAKAKLWKAGFRSNNIDPNARHCMASAAVAFMRTFGMDEPMVVITTSKMPKLLCFGVPTWRKCTRSYGPVLLTVDYPIRMLKWRYFPPMNTVVSN